MVEEQASSFPDGLDQWVEGRAAATGRDREEVLARAVATYRLLSEGEDKLTDEGVESLDDRLADVEQRVDQLDAETDEQVQDVRDRVVQVLKTAKGKADPEHDHPELAERVEHVDDDIAEVSDSLEGLRNELDGLQSELTSLEERVDGGFENYETVLTSLTDRADDVDGKLDTLAGAVVDLRKRAFELESAAARRNAVEELQRDANVRGISAADCESCGERVRLGLLSAPQCPHCREQFQSVEPGSRLFGSATLSVGDRPALTGEAFEPEEPAEVFEEDD